MIKPIPVQAGVPALADEHAAPPAIISLMRFAAVLRHLIDTLRGSIEASWVCDQAGTVGPYEAGRGVRQPNTMYRPKMRPLWRIGTT
jgi:hypothetical protein